VKRHCTGRLWSARSPGPYFKLCEQLQVIIDDLPPDGYEHDRDQTAFRKAVGHVPVKIHVIKAERRVPVDFKARVAPRFSSAAAGICRNCTSARSRERAMKILSLPPPVGLNKTLDIMQDRLLPLLALQVEKRQYPVSLELVIGQPVLQGNQYHLFIF